MVKFVQNIDQHLLESITTRVTLIENFASRKTV